VSKQKIIVLLYNRLFDPLVQSNIWLYIVDDLGSVQSNYEYHVVSFEDARFPLTSDQQRQVANWKARGLGWSPLRWHPGTGLLAKFLDVFTSLAALAKLRLRGYSHVVAYGSVSAAIAYLCSLVLRLRLFIHTFEPHSEYSLDAGIWTRTGWSYRMLHALERRAANYATVIASGTRFMHQRLKEEWKVIGSFYRIPSTADCAKFTFNSTVRESLRNDLGFSNTHRVIVYAGKFGGLYYTDELACMFRWLYELDSQLRLLVVTPNSNAEVQQILVRNGLDPAVYRVRHSGYQDIQSYYFAADFAVVAVPPGPSKKYISNIKVGEYLCAGLPYLITRGVSEDYVVALEQDVGVVVDNFHEADIKAAWPAIRCYLEMPADERRRHCREVGVAYRGFAALNPVFRSAMQELVDGKRLKTIRTV
jgi:hypothetical protein